MQSGLKNAYESIKAFSETDFTDDLARFDVPILVLHSVMGGIGTPVLLVAHS